MSKISYRKRSDNTNENSKDKIKIFAPTNFPKFTINKLFIDCNSLDECSTKEKKEKIISIKNMKPGQKSLSNEQTSKKNKNVLMNKSNTNNKIFINCLNGKQPKPLNINDKKGNLTKSNLMSSAKGLKGNKDSQDINSNKNDNYFNEQYQRSGKHSNSFRISNNNGMMNRIKQNIKESNAPSKFSTNQKVNNPPNMNNVNKQRLTFTNVKDKSQKSPLNYIYDFNHKSSKDEKKNKNNSDSSEDKKNKKIKKGNDNSNSSQSSDESEENNNKIVPKSTFEIGKNHGIFIDNFFNNRIPNKNIRNNKKTNTQAIKTVSMGRRGYRNSVQQNQIPILNEKIILSSVLSKPGVSDEEEKTNQDSYIVKENIFSSNFHLYGIFDGHGENGHLISQYISKYINEFYSEKSNYLSVNPNSSSKKSENKIFLDNYAKIIKKQRNDLDTTINSKITFNVSLSGSTSLLLFLTDETLICSNVGDSECYLFSCTQEDLWSFESLSKRHRPTEAAEKKRIIDKGGEIHPYFDENGIFEGPDRIYVKNKPYPGLSLSRTIGDLEGKKIGIISEPDITVRNLDENSKFIVMGSDGLWDVIKPYDVSRMVRPYFNKRDTDGACKILLKKAEQLYKKNNEERDDITIIVIFVGKPNIQLLKDSKKYLNKIQENITGENEGSTNDTPLILNLG